MDAEAEAGEDSANEYQRSPLGGLSGLRGAYDDDGGWDEEWYDKLSLALLVVSIRWWVSSVPILEPVE